MPDANRAPGILKGRIYKAMPIKARCHPEAGLVMLFVQERLLVIAKCRICNTEICRFEVAKEFSRGNSDAAKSSELAVFGS